MTVPDPAALGCDPRSPDGERQRRRLAAALAVVETDMPWPQALGDGNVTATPHATRAAVLGYLRDPPVHAPPALREAWATLRALDLGAATLDVFDAYRLALVWCLSAICYTHLGPGKRAAAAMHVREVLRCAVDARVARGARPWVAAVRVWLAYALARWRLRRW